MQDKVNFLILDEPTNHLDIQSREWIEDAVQDFDGTLLFISHDRYFLGKFASKIWAMKDGGISEFFGSFEDYMHMLELEKATQNSPNSSKQKKKKPPKAAKVQDKVASPEALIYEAEAKLDEVSQEIEASLAACEYQKMDELYQKKRELESQIAALYADWI